MADRFYPVILSVYTSDDDWNSVKHSQTINSDIEFNHFYNRFNKSGNLIKEVSTLEGLAAQKKDNQEKEELAELNKKKIILDIKATEQVVKSYPFTKRAALAGLIISIILAVIEIIKLFKKMS